MVKSLNYLCFIPPDDSVNSESVAGVKPGDSNEVIGYQADEFTHTWLAEHFLFNHTLTPGSEQDASSNLLPV